MLGGSLAAANQKRCAHTSPPPFNPRRWSSFPHPSALTRFTFKEGTPTPADYTQANIGTALEQGGVDQTEQSEEENPEWIQAGRSGSGSEPRSTDETQQGGNGTHPPFFTLLGWERKTVVVSCCQRQQTDQRKGQTGWRAVRKQTQNKLG